MFPGFWMVWREGGNAPTAKHLTEADAEREAERLARSNRGESFYVLKATGQVTTSDVRWDREPHDLPF